MLVLLAFLRRQAPRYANWMVLSSILRQSPQVARYRDLPVARAGTGRDAAAQQLRNALESAGTDCVLLRLCIADAEQRLGRADVQPRI